MATVWEPVPCVNVFGVMRLIVGVTVGATTSNENWLEDWLPSITFAYHVAAVVPNVGFNTSCVELRETIGMLG